MSRELFHREKVSEHLLSVGVSRRGARLRKRAGVHRRSEKLAGLLPPNSQDDPVVQMARKLAATIGSEFFATAARYLSRELSAEGVLFGEFINGRGEEIRTLAAI